MKKTNKLAFIIIAVLFLWFVSGVIFPNNDSETSSNATLIANQEAKVLSKLKFSKIKQQKFKRELVLYGETEVSRRVALKAETKGVVMAIPHREGSIIKKGDVIIKVDMLVRKERLSQAKALLSQRNIEAKAAIRLQKKGFQTEVRLAETKARLQSARAELKSIQLDIDKVRLKAPFDGVLEKINVEIGDFVGVGVFGGEGAVAELVDMDPLLITASVPQDEISFIKIGLIAKIVLKNDKKRDITGKVSFVARVADKVTRTFRVEVEIPNKDKQVLAGLSAEAFIPVETVAAYKIPSSAFILDDKGAVGVKTVNDENIVEFKNVEVLKEDSGDMWVSGLSGEVTIISVGGNYVAVGQKIDGKYLLSILPSP